MNEHHMHAYNRAAEVLAGLEKSHPHHTYAISHAASRIYESPATARTTLAEALDTALAPDLDADDAAKVIQAFGALLTLARAVRP